VSNFRGDANLSNDTTHIAPISLSEGGETISNDYENAQPPKESLSNFTFPDIQTRSTTSAIEVSGLIDASTLPNNAEIVLVGNTNLFMDVNKTLKCIRGDYALTISGGNILTLNNPEDYAIDVFSVTVSAPLNVISSNVAIAAENGITINNTVNATSTNTCIGTVNGTISINADVTVTTNSSAAILNRGLDNGGDIIINNGVIKATGGNSGIWAYGIAARGSITSQAGTIINATGGTGIYAEEGNIHLAGDVVSIAKGEDGSGVYAQAGEVSLSTISVSSSCVGISAKNGLTLNGDVEINSANTGIGTVNGTLTINGDVTVTTNSSAAILNRGLDNGGDIIINNGVIKATGGNSGIWAYGIAARGSITSQAGTIINATGGTGIYAEEGNIHLAGDVVSIAKGEDGSGVYAQAGEVSLSTISVSSSCVGISAKNGLTLNGDVEINSANTGIGTVNGTLTINGDVTVTTNSSAAILNRGLDNGGDIIINNGVIKATGGNSGIWAYGIAARGSITSQAGTIINATGGTGIYAEEGNIHLAGDVVSIAKGDEGYGVYAEAGEVSLSTISVPSSCVGISAKNGLTLNGDVEINSADTGIGTVNGTLTINGDVTVTTNSSAAILNRGLDNGGDIIINKGVINATGGNSGIWAYGIAARGNLNVKSGKVTAKGGIAGLYTEDGTITITSPLIIASPWEGQISNDGHYIVDENNEVQTRVIIMIPPMSGSVTLSSIPTPGVSLGLSLSGNADLSEISCRWQISENDVTWSDIEGATDKVYVPKESEVGKYIRVRVESAIFSGYLYSPSRQVTKRLCTDVPVAPVLTNINDKVYLSNAKTTQEYIIFNYSKEISSLTENDWNNAVTPDSEVGFFELNSTTNANHTVFTRVKETASAWASESVAESRIYIGTSVYLQDIELNISKTLGFFQEFFNELNCKVGDVIRCDASPVPSDATNWYGISGSNWTVDNHNTGSPYGEFYEDEECTIPISPTTNYETVFLKTLAEKNYLEVRILLYNSAIGYKTRAMQFNVSYDGTFPPIDHLSGCSHTIAAGEKMTNLDVARCPLSASVYGVTTEVTGEGTAPIVRFDFYEKMNIDATNATPGVYTYTPIQNGNPIGTSAFTVTVTDGKYPVEDIDLVQTELTADPGESLELVTHLSPVNSETTISWESSDYSVATVSDGKVNISPDAEIGEEVVITASAEGERGSKISSSCVITVSGEEYDLYVASTRVTSRNRDDILGDGIFSFNGVNKLTINGDYTLNTPVRLVENKGIDGLVIEVAVNSTINQDVNVETNVFDFAANTIIKGEGQLTVNANDIGFHVANGATLTLDSINLVVNGQFPMTGDIGGDEKLSIINSRVEIHALGSAAVDDFGGGITLKDCIISEPEGGEVVGATIEDSNGNYVRNLLIIPYVEKKEAVLEFAVTEMAVEMGEEAFVNSPMLWNPMNLAVTYSSSDMSVATVYDDGLVYISSPGTAIITAYYEGDYYTLPGSASYELIVIKPAVVFVGDGDWYAITEWQDEKTPEETDNVIIRGNVYINDNVWINSIIIEDGATLNVNSGKLIVAEGIINNDADAFIIHDGAQVMQNNGNVYATFEMNISNPSSWTDDIKGGWQFIASPVKNAAISDFVPYTSDYDLYKYDGSRNLQWVNYKNHIDDFETTFRQGRAYLSSYETETKATFKGVLNYETSFTFTDIKSHDYNDDYANYYLVGNPFTFDINWNKMTLYNIYDGIAKLNDVDGTYDYDIDTDIKVGDGFFVMATAEDPSLSYNNARKGREVHESINVIATNSEGGDNVVIHFAGADKGGFVKLKNLNDDVAEIYVKKDNTVYGILSYDESEEEIPLYFSPKQMGTYNIRVETDGNFKYIGLLDKSTGEETDILKETYTFTSLSSDFHDRFILKIDNSQQPTDNGHFAYVSGEEIIITDISGEAQINIYDALGRCVLRMDAASHVRTGVSGRDAACHVHIDRFDSGVYIIQKIDENGVNVQKLIVNSL